MILYVTVKPGRRKDKIEKSGDSWIIHLNAPAVDGKANRRLIEYLSKLLHLSKSKIELVKGHTLRLKCLRIDAEESLLLKQLESEIKRKAEAQQTDHSSL